MPEPDPRRVRMVELRHQLHTLAQQMLSAPVDSPERDALDDRLMETPWTVAALREELEA